MRFGCKVSKHELLTFLADNPEVTKKQVAEAFGLAYISACLNINRLMKQGLVRPVSISNITGRTSFSITDKGRERLEYFDNGGCTNRYCSCQKNR